MAIARRTRPPIRPPAESRAFVDAILGELRSSGWSLAGWARFLTRSTVRSAEQARRHPRAAVELSVAHLALLARGRWRWPLASWVMWITHLGLLDGRDRLGWADRLSLLRAGLPALAPAERAAWAGVVALASDWADGRLARRAGTTAYGAYADALADAAFWVWYAHRHERDPRLRALSVAIWLGPPVAVALSYVLSGRAVDYPRPLAVRRAAVCAQGLLTVRALASIPGGNSPLASPHLAAGPPHPPVL